MSYILCSSNESRKISAAYFNNYAYGFPHPNRIMEEHDLIYMCEGEWEICLEENPILLKKDMVLFLPAGVHHYGVKKCLDGTKTMFIHVSAMEDSFHEEEFIWGNKEKIPLQPLTDCTSAKRVRTLFEHIVSEFSSDHGYRESSMSALFQLLLVELYRTQQMAEGETEDEIVRETVRMIRENPGHFHTVQELAEQLHVSPRTLTGHFNRELGTTLHRYEMNMKLEAVAAFIKEYPYVKLHEVARNFGFYDEFHLSRAFSRKFSVPPAQYRKSVID